MGVVLITGCSSGFGLETALAFARRGDTTYASMRDPRRASVLLRRAEADGLDLEVLALDVTDEASVAEAVRHVEDRHGAVDVLVGEDAAAYIDLAARAGGYEGWAKATTEVFASVAGPRPAPAPRPAPHSPR